ncbi:MAG: spore cortex biosynthesis protein YabQ [Herbinix sp.]|nr:spore cortex biosynthesis protein YabQ [Herbinix sp.]
MNHDISVELQFFLISVLWGAILLLVYDCLRIFRRLIKHDTFFVALEDLIFWVFASLFIFIMMYKENNGIIRGFSVMGMAIGMVLYHYIVSDFIVSMITKLIRTLISPFVFAINKIKGFVRFIWLRGKKAVNFIIRRLKKWTKSVRIALNKRKQVTAVQRQQRLKEKMLKNQKKEEKKQSSEKSKITKSEKNKKQKVDIKQKDNKKQKENKKQKVDNQHNKDKQQNKKQRPISNKSGYDINVLANKDR